MKINEAQLLRIGADNFYSLIPSTSVRSAFASVMAAWIDVSCRELSHQGFRRMV